MFKKKLILFGKVLGALALVVALGSQVVSAPKHGAADGPRFNFLPDDSELFRGKNISKNETLYTDPVVAGNAEVVDGLIYYHNGVPGTTAKNTIVKVTLPSANSSAQKVLTASVSADNAQGVNAASDTLTVNTPASDASVSFVPGSVRWFPNKSDVPIVLPGGQTGDSLITPQGINIGDIEGCWDFSGFVMFRVKISVPTPPGKLSIEKSVRNATANESAFVKSNEARANDRLDYKLVIKNPGESALSTVLVRDVLPTGVAMVPGSLVYTAAPGAGASALPGGQNGDNIVSNGVEVGPLNAGAAGEQTFVFSVKTASSGLTDGQVLINKGVAASGSLKAEGTAQTIIRVVSSNIVKSKSAFNITQNIDATSSPANPGDTIKYTLKTRNAGNAIGKVEIKDGIADILEYTDVVDISGGQVVNQPSEPNEDNRIVISYGEKDLAIGQEIVSTFTVKIKNPLPTNPPQGNHFDLVMFNTYGNNVVIKIKPPVVVPNLSLVKTVRNVTTNEIDFTSQDKAFAGDTLEYQLAVKNIGSGPADAVKFVDTLPANVTYIAGTTVINRSGTSNTLVDGITASGITLPQIPVGQTVLIYLRAKIDSGVQVNTSLVNTIVVTFSTKSLTSQATTLVGAPVVTAAVTPPKVQLPKTGAAGALASVFGAIFLVTNLIYFAGKKKLLEAALIANS